MSIASQNGWLVQAGAALHVPSGPSLHLHVILNDPITAPGYGAAVVIVLVGISSIPQQTAIFFGQTCILLSGSHPSIHHDSFVYYKGDSLSKPEILSNE
jgi:hypothetical protein